MRTFTEIPDDRILAVIPGQLIESYAETLAQTMTANRTMLDFYEGHKASVG